MIPLRIGRLTLRAHVGLAVIAAALFVLGGDPWVRYLLLLATLLLHELAHAVVSLGFRSERAIVSLWPWGGVAHVERFSDYREALAALAGPASNLAVAGGTLLAGGEFSLELGRCPLLDFVFTCNLGMGLANLLPVPGLDGGRALGIFLKRRPN
jgi:stage IV sporulation protein FB